MPLMPGYGLTAGAELIRRPLDGGLPSSRDAAVRDCVAAIAKTFDIPTVALLADGLDGVWTVLSSAVDAPGRDRESLWLRRLAADRSQILVGAEAEVFRWPGACCLLAMRLPRDAEGREAGLFFFQAGDASSRVFDAALLARLFDQSALISAALRQHRQILEQARVLDAQAASLAHSRKIFERSSEAARIGVWECALETEALAWTDGVYDLFDLPRGSAVTRKQVLNYYSPDSRAELETRRSEAIRNRTGFTMDARIVSAKGHQRWMRITATVECDGERPVRLFGMKQDITEARELADRTRYLAEFDTLTGLANRAVFQARLNELDQAGGGTAALILIDLDGFKRVNDTFGHSLGDECLKEIADRLTEICTSADLVARIGGDEFAVLTRDSVAEDELARLATDIVEGLRKPIHRGDQCFQLGASVGIALCGSQADAEARDLYPRADTALYAAKEAGKNTFRFFAPVMKLAADLRIATVATLSKALDGGQLDLHYQPKINLEDETLRGFEALLRWRRPDGRIVSAGEFASAFDDPELSRRIGRLVTTRALDQAAEWKRQGLRFGHIAINVGSRQLQSQRFADDLIRQITDRELDPQSIEVEITEGVFLSDESGPAFQIMKLLRSKGIRIAIDDFGTGYASLVHLRDFPVDTIKVDRSFVQRCLTSAADGAILEAVLHLGLRLGKEVVAEGVETNEQLERLRALGCSSAQGFYFSKALPAEEAAPWVNARRRGIGRVA